MIRYLIDFALRNRILVLSVALVLFVWGIISFHNLPIEAYPDVADTYTQIITQWPGHAAEEVEQQITVPLEVQLNGVAHMTHLRSVSLAGLSVITIIYDDETTTFNCPPGSARPLAAGHRASEREPRSGPGLQPDRADHVLHAHEHKSEVRRDGTKDAARLVRAQPIEVSAQRGGRKHFRRADARIPGADSIPANWFPMGCRSARWNRRSPTTTSTPAAASSSAASRP